MKTIAIIPVSRFSHAKTRLSPTLSPEERENLLKSMLKDVIKVLRESFDEVVVISSDKDVLDYVDALNVTPLKEEGETDLNGALTQALKYSSQNASRALIVPSDVPLIQEKQVKEILKIGEYKEVVIAPAKGGGTNTLLCPTRGMLMKFGDCSFFEHIKEARDRGFSLEIYDSFYLSLDVNTSEDLGEIMIHGAGTQTRSYLKDMGLKVISNHGSERLRVKRKDET